MHLEFHILEHCGASQNFYSNWTRGLSLKFVLRHSFHCLDYHQYKFVTKWTKKVYVILEQKYDKQT